MICANRDGAVPTSIRDRLEGDAITGLVKAADVAIRSTGGVSEFIVAYHEAMVKLTGRRDLRDDVSRYEAISLVLASPEDATLGNVVREYPNVESPLHVDKFFEGLYRSYDLRYVYAAKLLQSRTRRLVWDRESPAVFDPRAAGMTPRIGDDTAEPGPSLEVDSPADDDGAASAADNDDSVD